jgi:acyl carrier protein
VSASHGELTMDTPLLGSEALDSLGILNLTAHLEETQNIRIADEDFVPENFETVGSVVRFIVRHKGAKG